MHIVPKNDASVSEVPPLTQAQLRRELKLQRAELARQVWEYQDLREQLLNAKPAYKREYVKRMLEIFQPLPEQRRIIRRLEGELAARAR